jgi:hypothetical protein
MIDVVCNVGEFMSTIRIITSAMVVAWIGCLAMSEQPSDAALENDGDIKPAARSDAIDLTDFDPLAARPAGIIKPRNYKPPAKTVTLPREGSKVVDRLCRITTDPSGWVLARFPAEGEGFYIKIADSPTAELV